MDVTVAGNTAVVTGASKGIGLAITQALTDAGAHVVAGSRTRTEELGELVDAGRATFAEVDLTDPAAPAALVAAAASAVGATPLGRFSTPQEVADLVVFLASDRAANITGADMTIDSGMITTVR